MRPATAVKLEADMLSQPVPIPTTFLNCYAISPRSTLAWQVSTYVVTRVDGQAQTHHDRGAIKNVIWTLRKQYPGRCLGYGFVVDVNEQLVAVPATWDLPSSSEVNGYRVTWGRTFATSANVAQDRPIIAGIVREALKQHFKHNRSEDLGPLWQDYDQFCQMPQEGEDRAYLSCRRFGAAAKVLRDNQWVLEFLTSAATLDSNTFSDYYRRGEVNILAGMIECKRANRITR